MHAQTSERGICVFRIVCRCGHTIIGRAEERADAAAAVSWICAKARVAVAVALA